MQRLQTFYSGQRGSQTPKNDAVPHSGARGLIVIRRRPKPPVGRRLNDIMVEESLPPAHSPVVDLVRNLVRKRDFYAGGLIIFFGLVMALKGPGYRLGTLMHMGPGFMPTVLGIILICLGIAIAGTGLTVPEGEDEDILPKNPEWFGWACILAGPLCFILFGSYFGLIPAIFTCVFVAARGDRTATLKSSLLLAAFVTVFGVGLFSYVLQVPMPLLTWRGL